jgi:hypothetical protein
MSRPVKFGGCWCVIVGRLNLRTASLTEPVFAHTRRIFLNFNPFLIIYKINHWKTLFAKGNPLAAPLGRRGRWPLPRHTQRRGRCATLASRGVWRGRGPGPAAPDAPARQPCRTTPPGAAGVCLQARRCLLSSSSSFSSLPGPNCPPPKLPPPPLGPKSVDLGWEKWGKSFPTSL